jgi:hypothetical protein
LIQKTIKIYCLERRKYVAVWFSSIQERIQCWPAQYSYDLTVISFGKACAKLFVDEENVGCAKIKSWKNKNIGFYSKTTQKGGLYYIILFLMNLHATCLPHHPSSVIYSSYHTLLCKLWNCSRFIINHVLMAIPPTDNAKHLNSFH